MEKIMIEGISVSYDAETKVARIEEPLTNERIDRIKKLLLLVKLDVNAFVFISQPKTISNMKDPKDIKEVIPGASFLIPTYQVTENGLEDAIPIPVYFCKGDKSNPEIFRQEGVLTETLLELAKLQLESVNVAPLASRETSMAITKIDEALMWISKRANDRKARGVQGTYQK